MSHVLFRDRRDMHISDEVICDCDKITTIALVDAGGRVGGCDDLGVEGVVGEGGALMGGGELGIELEGTKDYIS